MVFGIGLAKTGTSSLNKCLDLLGLPSIHYPDPALMLAGRFEEAFRGHAAATDITVSVFFEELDMAYPGSKFILTLRDMDDWMASIGSHINRIAREEWTPAHPKGRIRELMFGTVGWDAELFRSSYDTHRTRVERYFAGRPGDLLTVDLCAGCGWEPLCAFLGSPVPAAPFPHENKRPLTHAA